MSDGRRSRAGFSLLEVMLALTCLALVSAICYGAFHLGIRAVERGEIAVVTAQRLRAASDVLIRQVKSAVPYQARNEDDEVYPYFFGSPTEMTFVTAAGLVGGGGLTRVSYRLEPDPPRLVLEETPVFSPDALGGATFDPIGARAAVLLDSFESLQFAYLLYDGVDYDWRKSWDPREEEMLPVAIRVGIEGVPGTEAGWHQEIPIMACAYGETSCEVDDDLPERVPDDEATSPGSGNRDTDGDGDTDGDTDADEDDDAEDAE